MPANADDQCCVYYISEPIPTVTVMLASLLMKGAEGPPIVGDFSPVGFVWMILFMGTRKECGAVEMKYRPERGIGWNTDLGGGRWRNLKFKSDGFEANE